MYPWETLVKGSVIFFNIALNATADMKCILKVLPSPVDVGVTPSILKTNNLKSKVVPRSSALIVISSRSSPLKGLALAYSIGSSLCLSVGSAFSNNPILFCSNCTFILFFG